MKKLFAMLLAAVMLLTSVAAVAETFSTTGIMLKDFVLKQDGEVMADLTGLGIALKAGTTVDQDAFAVTAGVYGGAQEAMSAIAGFVDGKIVANVDGMSKPLTLDLTDGGLMGLLTSQMNADELAGMAKVTAAITSLTGDDALLNLLMGYATYQNEMNGLLTENMTAEENVPYEFLMGEGEQTANRVIVNLTGETMAAVSEAGIKFYDSQPAILDLINGLMMMSGEEPITSFAETLDQESLEDIYSEFDMQITLYANEDASMMDLDVSIYDDLTAEDPYCYGAFVMAYGLTDTLDVMLMGMDDYGYEVYLAYSMYESETFPGEYEHAAYIAESEYGEETTLLSAWVGPDAELGTLGSIIVNPDDEDDAVGIAWSYSDEMIAFNAYDNYIDFTATATLNGDEVDLCFSYEEYGSVTELDCTLALTAGTVDVAELKNLASGAGINMLTLSEDDLSTIIQELTFPAMSALGVLGQNVPGLTPLLGF